MLSAGTTVAFAPIKKCSGSNFHLFAEGGPPQYEKMAATLRESKQVGEGSFLLTIDRADAEADWTYEPGHVLALELPGTLATETLGIELDEKTRKDMDQNDGWLRGPYTVSRIDGGSSLDILIKVVGAKSTALAGAPPGTPLKLGGQFKVPIAKGIDRSPESPIQRIALISTGVGLGPCWGALQELWEDGDGNSRMIPSELIASYRQESEELFADEFQAAMADSTKEFTYKPIITNTIGRLSANDENLQMVLPTPDSSSCPVEQTHYHLIGNGQLVNEWKEGLASAGVPDAHVTVESYFNHRAETSSEAIERIAKVIGHARSVESPASSESAVAAA